MTSDLKWHKNTKMLVKKAFTRMVILQKLNKFKVKISDLLIIYKLYIRSIVEQNCQVWHYSLSEDDSHSLERVQKVAMKIILQQSYTDYNQALDILELETLYERREHLCLKFARKCTKHPRAKAMFPLNPGSVNNSRYHEKFFVQPAKSGRLLHSAIPQMQRALNLEFLNRSS